MAIGYISLGIVGFLLAVKYFAVLPGDIKDWNHMFRSAPWRRPTAQPGQNVKSNPPEGEQAWPASLSTR
jgi:hypothetical protein